MPVTDNLTNIQTSPQVLVNEKPDVLVNVATSNQVLVKEKPDFVVQTQTSSQAIVETISGTRVSQIAIEALNQQSSNVRVSQIAIEALNQQSSQVRVSQIAIEVLSRTPIAETVTNVGTSTQVISFESPDYSVNAQRSTQTLSEVITEAVTNTEINTQRLGFENPDVVVNTGLSTQILVETLAPETVTNIQLGIQTLADEGIITGTPFPRLTQATLEVLRNKTVLPAQLSQLTLEVLVKVGGGTPIFTQSFRRGNASFVAAAGSGGSAGVIHMGGKFRISSSAFSTAVSSSVGGKHMEGHFRRGN